MSTLYPQEPGKNTGNPSGPPPTDPYGLDPTRPSSPHNRPPSPPYGPLPSQPDRAPPPPYGAAQQGPVTPIPHYQEYPAGWQPPYSPTSGSYGAPPPAPRAKSNARRLIIMLVVLV